MLAVTYGIIGTLSSGIEKNPLYNRYVEIENPVNRRIARGMVTDKYIGYISGYISSINVNLRYKAKFPIVNKY